MIISCICYCLQGHLADVQNFQNSSESQLLFLSDTVLRHVLGQLFEDKEVLSVRVYGGLDQCYCVSNFTYRFLNLELKEPIQSMLCTQ